MTIDDDFEIKFLPGIPPREGGCPPPNPRVESVAGMVIEYDAAVRMRDGVEIYADVFRSEQAEPVPVIVAWGPYGKHGPVKYDLFPNHGIDPDWVSAYAGFEAPDPVYWTRHGYAVINVDPRGMWNSQGDATFYSAQEARDAYDLIEWAGTQPWSSGKVGMSGVSYLAITQWRVAADHPPHLAAINPWEGLSDRYREMSYHGGIPEDRFGPMWRSRRVPYSTGRVEDTVAMYAEHPVFEWLLVHGRKKWQFYYQPENVELLRAFFDRFLRGVATSVDSWPRVRVEVRERFYVGDYRDNREWPLADTEYRRLYLDASTAQLGESPSDAEAQVGYAAEGTGHVEFSHRFEAAADLVGPMRLHLWVQAEGADDMDLFVAIQKFDEDGEIVPFSFFNSLEDGPVALGWLRVSHRELDEARSSPGQPWHPHRREELLTPGEAVAADIEIWPSGTRFGAGEELRLIIQGSDIYTYPPGVVNAGHSRTGNAGRHIVHTGGRYDSHLLIPEVPA